MSRHEDFNEMNAHREGRKRSETESILTIRRRESLKHFIL